MNPAPQPLPDALRLIYIMDVEGASDWRRVDALLEGGVSTVWLRSPGATGAVIYRTTKDLVRRCHAAGAAVLVGDRADAALAAGADGVQLGFRSPPAHRIRPWFSGWIGVSCHSAGELAKAEKAGADFAVLSPVFGVPDKGAPLGPTALTALVADTTLPVVALGGVDTTNVQELRNSGAAGIAVIRALRESPDPAGAARLLRDCEMTPR